MHRIVRAVDVPVTADVERGYGLAPGSLVDALGEAGVVGCNLEDSVPSTGELATIEEQVQFLTAVKESTRETKLGLFVNARVDVYVRTSGEGEQRLGEATRRARRYLEAGADCCYPIGIVNDDMKRFTTEVNGLVNVVFQPGAPSFEDLARMEVARITFGGGLHIAMQLRLGSLARRLAAGLDPYSKRA